LNEKFNHRLSNYGIEAAAANRVRSNFINAARNDDATRASDSGLLPVSWTPGLGVS
jgi:hypothetical protein